MALFIFSINCQGHGGKNSSKESKRCCESVEKMCLSLPFCSCSLVLTTDVGEAFAWALGGSVSVLSHSLVRICCYGFCKFA